MVLDGVSMGSPLAPMISEIFMNHFEEKIFNSSFSLIQHLELDITKQDFLYIECNGSQH